MWLASWNIHFEILGVLIKCLCAKMPQIHGKMFKLWVLLSGPKPGVLGSFPIHRYIQWTPKRHSLGENCIFSCIIFGCYAPGVRCEPEKQERKNAIAANCTNIKRRGASVDLNPIQQVMRVWWCNQWTKFGIDRLSGFCLSWCEKWSFPIPKQYYPQHSVLR